jgi:hypothetical protein
MRSAWFLDNDASHHMIEERDLFNIIMERKSNVHVELDDDANYVVKGEGTIMFQPELGGLFDAHDVIYVLEEEFTFSLNYGGHGFCCYFS